MSSLYSGIIPIIKQAALEAVDSTQPVNILFGKVISIAPLKIQVSQKLTLGAGNLVLPDSLSKKTHKVTLSGNTEKNARVEGHTHDFTSNQFTLTLDGTDSNGDTISLTKQFKVSGTTDKSDREEGHYHKFNTTLNLVIDNSLKVGDSVILARMQGGNKYLVLDKAVSA